MFLWSPFKALRPDVLFGKSDARKRKEQEKREKKLLEQQALVHQQQLEQQQQQHRQQLEQQKLAQKSQPDATPSIIEEHDSEYNDDRQNHKRYSGSSPRHLGKDAKKKLLGRIGNLVGIFKNNKRNIPKDEFIQLIKIIESIFFDNTNDSTWSTRERSSQRENGSSQKENGSPSRENGSPQRENKSPQKIESHYNNSPKSKSSNRPKPNHKKLCLETFKINELEGKNIERLKYILGECILAKKDKTSTDEDIKQINEMIGKIQDEIKKPLETACLDKFYNGNTIDINELNKVTEKELRQILAKCEQAKIDNNNPKIISMIIELRGKITQLINGKGYELNKARGEKRTTIINDTHNIDEDRKLCNTLNNLESKNGKELQELYDICKIICNIDNNTDCPILKILDLKLTEQQYKESIANLYYKVSNINKDSTEQHCISLYNSINGIYDNINSLTNSIKKTEFKDSILKIKHFFNSNIRKFKKTNNILFNFISSNQEQSPRAPAPAAAKATAPAPSAALAPAAAPAPAASAASAAKATATAPAPSAAQHHLAPAASAPLAPAASAPLRPATAAPTSPQSRTHTDFLHKSSRGSITHNPLNLYNVGYQVKNQHNGDLVKLTNICRQIKSKPTNIETNINACLEILRIYPDDTKKKIIKGYIPKSIATINKPEFDKLLKALK
jgi:hypothetical protein